MTIDLDAHENGGPVTLRDQFMMAALTGLLAFDPNDSWAVLALSAREIADACMAERKK